MYLLVEFDFKKIKKLNLNLKMQTINLMQPYNLIQSDQSDLNYFFSKNQSDLNYFFSKNQSDLNYFCSKNQSDLNYFCSKNQSANDRLKNFESAIENNNEHRTIMREKFNKKKSPEENIIKNDNKINKLNEKKIMLF